MSMPSFSDAPRATLALGLAALGATAVASGDFLPQLQPVGELGAARWALAPAHGAIVVVLALLMVCRRTSDGARRALALLLLAWCVLATAAMFGAWLPLAHLGRLIERRGNPFELTFASMALALTGAAWCVAALTDPRTAANAASTTTARGAVAE